MPCPKKPVGTTAAALPEKLPVKPLVKLDSPSRVFCVPENAIRYTITKVSVSLGASVTAVKVNNLVDPV